MSIAAIVPVWNGREWLARMLASLARQTRPAAHLIAVDNGSTDGAPDLAREAGALVIPLGSNAGFAAAVNRGIEECGRLPIAPQFIAVLNSDVELAPDYLEKLAADIFEMGAWFATGKLLTPSTQSIDGTFDATCRGGTSWRVGSGREDGAAFSERRRITSVPFTAALFRAEIFRRVGMLDARFESYLEDVDFGLRCAARGVDGGVYEPAAVAWHKGSASLGRWNRQTVRRIARNQLYLVAKHYPTRLLRRWLRPIVVAQMLWGGVALRHGAGAAWLRGLVEGLARFRKMRKDAEPIDERLLSQLLSSNDHLIREYQYSTGYDAYWRWYFRLAGEA
jgi:GT2 family glycosyltransferase